MLELKNMIDKKKYIYIVLKELNKSERDATVINVIAEELFRNMGRLHSYW
jgi:hypothetical protein